jgi:hypothetical protein
MFNKKIEDLSVDIAFEKGKQQALEPTSKSLELV